MPIKYNKLAMQSQYDRPFQSPRPLRPMPIVVRPIFYDAENDKIIDRTEPLEKEQTFKSDILKKK